MLQRSRRWSVEKKLAMVCESLEPGQNRLGGGQAQWHQSDQLFPRSSCTPIECYVVLGKCQPATGTYEVLSNLQGLYALDSVMSRTLNVPSNRLRLRTPPDSGGSFRIKQSVFPYIMLLQGRGGMQLGKLPASKNLAPGRSARLPTMCKRNIKDSLHTSPPAAIATLGKARGFNTARVVAAFLTQDPG